MVQDLELRNQMCQFPETAPAGLPVFFRTYSRRGVLAARETWEEVCDRVLIGLVKQGKLTAAQTSIIARMQRQMKSLPSGRWLWVGGTAWIEAPENFSGAYNCTSTNALDWRAFGLMMDLAMMGCGTGAVLEPKYISELPTIRNRLIVTVQRDIGTTPAPERREQTEVKIEGNSVTLHVGDSRQGWVKSYQTLLELSSDERFSNEVTIQINLSDVRPTGETLKGFGGVANPVKLPELYERCARILNQAVGRQLNSLECCLLIDEAAVVVVAGNVRRSAGMRQGDSKDNSFINAKDNLWQQDENGNWRIDRERDALRMANHTRVFHHKPTLEECIEAVRKQYYSGEGAIQWAGEAVARANCDLMSKPTLRTQFLQAYDKGKGKQWLQERHPQLSTSELEHRLSRYGLNPCVTADTWIHTEHGARQVKDLIGSQTSLYVNGELFSTTPEGFFKSGTKPVLKLQTQEGYALRLTTNHKVLKVTAQTQKKQYSEWVEAGTLEAGDRIVLHDHRGLQPWVGDGDFDEGWLLGSLIGDGCFINNQKNYQFQALLRFWGDSQVEMGDYAVSLVKKTAACPQNLRGVYHKQNRYIQISSGGLARLAQNYGITPDNKTVTRQVEEASYEFYQGFLRGLFDADGSVQGSQVKGISVRLSLLNAAAGAASGGTLSQSNLELLYSVQRMLARLGIVSCIYQNRRLEGYRMLDAGSLAGKPGSGDPLPDSNRDLAEYYCKAQHELVITNDNLQTFYSVIGFKDPDKNLRLELSLNGYKRKLNRERFTATVCRVSPDGVEPVYDCTVPGVSQFDANGIVAHNCGEIIGSDFHCNLSEIHLNQIDPYNHQEQEDAFTAGALSVAGLLNHKFVEARYQKSRELDPIVGVSFTGLFDFFVNAFGVDWLRWWQEGRPLTQAGIEFKRQEQEYLIRWKEIVHRVVWDYCDFHSIKRPNRCTTVQPSGTKSLLTGASPGWHPPFGLYFTRRITFAKNDPVALACLDYGYSVIPGQSDKDEQGNLLNDPNDPRVKEWLVEIPVEVAWSKIPGVEEIEIDKFSALSMFDFYLAVQKHWTTHNTSATILLTEAEIEPLGQRIYEAIRDDEGYISSAILAKFDAPFPRLPFQRISREEYELFRNEVWQRKKSNNFLQLLSSRLQESQLPETGPQDAACSSLSCEFTGSEPLR